jgi:CO/xanthine dehydrogenase FAD-binding subunit
MALLKTVFRPGSAAEAASLLAATDLKLAPIAGGSKLIAELETRARRDLDGLVDLSCAGLNRIDYISEGDQEYVRVGATATLSQVSEHELASTLADGLLLRAAACEGQINLRNAATIGGVVASAEYDSEFYAALLALRAGVVLHDGNQEQTVLLEDLQSIAGLITAVLIPTTSARGGTARVARTPADRPIVAAIAVRAGVGSVAGERIALCGVAARPVLLGAELNPPDDFKGSAVYRRAMAEIVVQRARAAIA